MDPPNPMAADLQGYLQASRDSIVASLDGLSEYDVRRPMTPTGTNLLGLVKHLIGIELGYLGDSVGRPAPLTLPWHVDGSVWEGADMWPTADDSREQLLAWYRTAGEHSDASIASLPLDAQAQVPWWDESRRDTTFGHLLARVVAETAQHAGHCDILRETIDGHAASNTSDVPADEWAAYVARIQAAADAHRQRDDTTRLLQSDVRTMALADLPLEPDSVVTGTPTASLAELADLGGLRIGVWELTAGTVTDVEADEVFVVLAGSASLTFEADGSTVELGPGTVVRLRAGDRTTWVVRETLRKVYFA